MLKHDRQPEENMFNMEHSGWEFVITCGAKEGILTFRLSLWKSIQILGIVSLKDILCFPTR